MRAYFDHAATSPPPEIAGREAQAPAPWGNPSSIHAEGRAARRALESAREGVAAALGVEPDEVIFTASGTESDNLALRGIAWSRTGRPHVVVSGIEHEAVHRTARFLHARGDADVEIVPPAPDGVVPAEAVSSRLRPDTALVSVMAVNNEIGTIQPLEAVGQACAALGIPLHVDAVQAPGRIPARPAAWGATLATYSAHKVGGPKGCGILVARRGLKLQGALTGGEQEWGLRPGTENVQAAVLGAEALCRALAEQAERARHLDALGRLLEEGLRSGGIGGVTVHGAGAPRAPGIVGAAFAGCPAAALVQSLDLAGFAVSSGSACSSGSVRPSRVLEAMGLPEAECRSSVRFSFGIGNRAEEVERLLAVLPGIVARIREHA